MTTKATRHPKTPAQRAQETVDVLTRRGAKLLSQRVALEKQAVVLASEIEVVTKRLDYALASPDLPAKQAAKETTS
jgi:hypothetical protein